MNIDIVKIINNWNPVEIYPLLEDEYYPEIKEIIKYINESENITLKNLALEIDNIFTKFFGSNIYISDLNKCKEIATEILDVIN